MEWVVNNVCVCVSVHSPRRLSLSKPVRPLRQAQGAERLRVCQHVSQIVYPCQRSPGTIRGADRQSAIQNLDAQLIKPPYLYKIVVCLYSSDKQTKIVRSFLTTDV